MDNEQKHDWLRVAFVFGEWIECLCGFKPESEKDLKRHEQEYPFEKIPG